MHRPITPDASAALAQRPRAAEVAIGVFDSGVGGLSVLDALRRRMPAATLRYVGDVAHAPYGDKTAAQVLARCERIVEWLCERGATTIVVACNTATALTIDALRVRWPALTFVGVEPGVKPAAALSRRGRIAVLATPATAGSARLRRLIETHAHGVQVHVEACPGLALSIERGVYDGDDLRALLEPHVQRVRASGADVVVLGCTHYPFVARAIQAALGDSIRIVDTAQAIAERVAAVHDHANAVTHARATSATRTVGELEIVSSGDVATMRALVARCASLAPARVDQVSI